MEELSAAASADSQAASHENARSIGDWLGRLEPACQEKEAFGAPDQKHEKSLVRSEKGKDVSVCKRASAAVFDKIVPSKRHRDNGDVEEEAAGVDEDSPLSTTGMEHDGDKPSPSAMEEEEEDVSMAVTGVEAALQDVALSASKPERDTKRVKRDHTPTAHQTSPSKKASLVWPPKFYGVNNRRDKGKHNRKTDDDSRVEKEAPSAKRLKLTKTEQSYHIKLCQDRSGSSKATTNHKARDSTGVAASTESDPSSLATPRGSSASTAAQNFRNADSTAPKPPPLTNKEEPRTPVPRDPKDESQARSARSVDKPHDSVETNQPNHDTAQEEFHEVNRPTCEDTALLSENSRPGSPRLYKFLKALLLGVVLGFSGWLFIANTAEDLLHKDWVISHTNVLMNKVWTTVERGITSIHSRLGWNAEPTSSWTLADVIGEPDDALGKCGIDVQMVVEKVHMIMSEEGKFAGEGSELLIPRMEELLGVVAPEHEAECSEQDLSKAKAASGFVLLASMGTYLDKNRIDGFDQKAENWVNVCLEGMDLDSCIQATHDTPLGQIFKALEDDFRMFCERRSREDANDTLPACYIPIARGRDEVDKQNLVFSLGALEKLACLVGLFCNGSTSEI